MRVQLEIGWGDPEEPSYTYWSDPQMIPQVGDAVSISQRDTDGTDLGSTPLLYVLGRDFTYERVGANARLDVQLWCGEKP